MREALPLLIVAVLFACGPKEAPMRIVLPSADPRDTAMHAAEEWGAAIFLAQCEACHRIEKDDGFDVRRALRHFPEPRARRLFGFLLHEDSLAAVGDPYVVELRRKWNATTWHHARIGLSREEALAVVVWLACGADGANASAARNPSR